MRSKLLSAALLLSVAPLACDAPETSEPGQSLREDDSENDGLIDTYELEYDFEANGHALSETFDLSSTADDTLVTLMLRTPYEPTPFSVYDDAGELLGESEVYAEFHGDDEGGEDDGPHYFTRFDIDPKYVDRIEVTAEVLDVITRGSLMLCHQFVTNRAPAGTGSLRRAVDQVRDGGSVCFDPVEFSDVSAGPVVLTSEIATSKDLSIWAPSGAVAQVTTQGNGRIFSFSGNATLRRVRLFDGSASEGGLVRADGRLSIFDSRLEEGVADNGGAVFITSSGELRLDGASIENSSATQSGGGVNSSGPVTALDAFIGHNQAGDHGGGLYLDDAATLTDTEVRQNEAGASGGGIAARHDLRLEAGTWVFRNGAYMGAGIDYRATGHTLVMDEASVHSNIASDALEDVPNAKRARGGGIYVRGGTIDILSDPQGAGLPSAIGSNRAIWGGGIYVDAYSTVQIRGDAHVHTNGAVLGGGVFNTSTLRLTENAELLDNWATEDGAGVMNHHQLEVRGNVQIRRNDANGNGGGIYNAGETYLLHPTIRVQNNVATLGGGIYDDGFLSYLRGTQQVANNSPHDVWPIPE